MSHDPNRCMITIRAHRRADGVLEHDVWCDTCDAWVADVTACATAQDSAPEVDTPR